MIRKIFASLTLFVFLIVMPSLLIVESIIVTFFNESFVKEKVIPETFVPVADFYAQQFAQEPSDAALFSQRIQQTFPRDVYHRLMGDVVTAFFQTLGHKTASGQPIVLDLTVLRADLKEILPQVVKNLPTCNISEEKSESFRFCKPKNFPPEKNFEATAASMIEKEIPRTFTLGKEGEPLRKPFYGLAAAKRYLTIFTSGTFVILLGILGLIIWRPLTSVLKWLGSALMGLTLILGVFVASLHRLPELLNMEMPKNQLALFTLLLDYPLWKLELWAIFLGLLGLILFLFGILIKSQK
ncbi:MAG: hypothetical protein AAB588_03805 [Patescibacteria group bacterium]|mgnify:CR=1 FL=1